MTQTPLTPLTPTDVVGFRCDTHVDVVDDDDDDDDNDNNNDDPAGLGIVPPKNMRSAMD